MKARATLLGLALVGAAIGPAAAGDVERGREVYARCAGCHSVDANRVGPKHRGVFGRRAGTVAEFEYSPALKASGVVWTAKTLDAWLADPGKFVPGSRMGYRLSNARDRQDVIAFLKSISGTQKSGR